MKTENLAMILLLTRTLVNSIGGIYMNGVLEFTVEKLSNDELQDLDLTLDFNSECSEELSSSLVEESEEVNEEFDKVDMLTETIDEVEQEDYSSWRSDCTINDRLSVNLSEKAKQDLQESLEDNLLEGKHFLQMRFGDLAIFSRDTKYGQLFDIVDTNMSCVKRLHYVRLDVVTKLLFEKYSENISDISKLINTEVYFSTDNFNKFNVGSYWI